jgi:hypothetical protein
LWGVKDTRYIKHAYHKPIVKNTDIKEISENRYRQASTPKIIIAGMTKDLECFYDANGDYLPGKSTIIILEETEFKLKYVLALLNSKLLRFFVRNYFSSLAMQGGCFSLNPEQFLKIPGYSDEIGHRSNPNRPPVHYKSAGSKRSDARVV